MEPESPPARPRYVLVLSEPDPVGRMLAEQLGTPPPTEWHVDGTPLRDLGEGVWTLRRRPAHITDDALGAALPRFLGAARVPLIFPSIHRSERGPRCFTVHPLGNPGARADVGGRPRTLVPTDPRLMTAALRGLAAKAPGLGLTVTFEATHHGPLLPGPAFFAEIGGGPDPEHPEPREVALLGSVLRSLEGDPSDRIAVGLGGGHYAPHFTELALRRQWAFGHLLSRYVLPELDDTLLREAWTMSPGAEGWLLARAADRPAAGRPGGGPVLRDVDAPNRAATEPR